MRFPRVRFTLRRLMVAVFVIGLALGGAAVFDQWVIERIAEFSYKKATLVRQAAESAVKAYEGDYLQDLATKRGQVALSRSDLERAIDRLEWSNKMKARGFVSETTHAANRLAREHAQFELEQAQTQLEVLQRYSKEKQMKTLRSNLEKARADEQAKLSVYRSERARRRNMTGF